MLLWSSCLLSCQMQVSVSRIPFVLSSYAFAQPLWETALHNTTKQLGKDRLSSQETEKHTEQTIKVHIWSYPIHPCPKPFPLPSGAQLTPPVSCNTRLAQRAAQAAPGWRSQQCTEPPIRWAACAGTAGKGRGGWPRGSGSCFSHVTAKTPSATTLEAV